MRRRDRARTLLIALLVALGASASAQPTPTGITSVPLPTAADRDPAAAPAIHRWTKSNLKTADSQQTFADLRKAYPELHLFRRAEASYGRVRTMFVPSAVRIDGRAYHLYFTRARDGTNTAYLVTSFPVEKIKSCESAFEQQLDAVAELLSFAPDRWSAERGERIAALSPFAVQASWTGEPRSEDQFDLAIYDPVWKPLAKHWSASGAGYATLPVSFPENLRPFAAYRRDPAGKRIDIAVAQVIQQPSNGKYTCRLALVRQGPAPKQADYPASYVFPKDALLSRADLWTNVRLASIYAVMRPASFGSSTPIAVPDRPVNFTCKVSADGGGLNDCHSDGARPDPANQATWNERYRELATLLAAHNLTAWQFDPDFLTDLPVRVRFAATAADFPPEIAWDSEPLGLPSKLVFNRRLTITSNDYPSRGLREEREAMVMMDCIILPDRSPYCGRFAIEPADAADAFAPVLRTIQRRSASRTAEPLTTDGKPSVGYRYRQRIRFQIPKD